MNDLMIDLETLGTDGPVVITSIAAVQFDIETGEIGSKFNVNIDVQSSLDVGLKVSGSTLAFWLGEKPETLKKCFENPQHINTALSRFKSFFDTLNLGSLDVSKEVIKVWGNSARFDLEKLSAAYRAINMSMPWNFRNERCYRTYNSDFKEVLKIMGIEIENTEAHNPEADCIYQIKTLCAIWQYINRGNDFGHVTDKALDLLRKVLRNKSFALTGLHAEIYDFFKRAAIPSEQVALPHTWQASKQGTYGDIVEQGAGDDYPVIDMVEHGAYPWNKAKEEDIPQPVKDKIFIDDPKPKKVVNQLERDATIKEHKDNIRRSKAHDEEME